MAIAHLSGKVIYKSTSWIIVEVNNVGYRVDMNTDLIQKDSDVNLFIYHYFREDAQKLIGFNSSEELEIFELLITVSGVGPKAGIAILNTFSVENLVGLIKSENSTEIAKVKGLGKKTADRIIVELKSKIEDFAFSVGVSVDGVQTVSKTDVPVGEAWNDAKFALKNLGYSDAEIVEALSLVNSDLKDAKDIDSQLLVRKAFGYLAK